MTLRPGDVFRLRLTHHHGLMQFIGSLKKPEVGEVFRAFRPSEEKIGLDSLNESEEQFIFATLAAILEDHPRVEFLGNVPIQDETLPAFRRGGHRNWEIYENGVSRKPRAEELHMLFDLPILELLPIDDIVNRFETGWHARLSTESAWQSLHRRRDSFEKAYVFIEFPREVHDDVITRLAASGIEAHRFYDNEICAELSGGPTAVAQMIEPLSATVERYRGGVTGMEFR